jgi:hypothetical protein
MRVGALCKDIILEEKNLYGDGKLKVAKIREVRGIGSLILVWGGTGFGYGRVGR